MGRNSPDLLSFSIVFYHLLGVGLLSVAGIIYFRAKMSYIYTFLIFLVIVTAPLFFF
ncbi:hypothetical protein J3Q64DRAFT_1726462 [Phycomyces blakesleeanus]|uniref:Uncharacterized protein n=1 Tax=Phycomyces blakesleeanus TaxID=4837 RepID=A0ABR3B8X1_PHYBL